MTNIAFAYIMLFLRYTIFIYLIIISVSRLIWRKSDKMKKIFRYSWISFFIIGLLELFYHLFVPGEFQYEVRVVIVDFAVAILKFLGMW